MQAKPVKLQGALVSILWLTLAVSPLVDGSTLRPTEKDFLAGPNAKNAKENLRFITSQPHVAGTEGDWVMGHFVSQKLTEAGIPQVSTYPLDVLLNYPVSPPNVTLRSSVDDSILYKAKLSEDILEFDDTSDTFWRNHSFHGYSPSGSATAPAVYANYGRREDFEALEKAGIDLKGKIVIVRYGQCFRGLKVMNAQSQGALAVLIYSDPADDGYSHGSVYPNGPWRSPSSFQRGSVQFISKCAGDPMRADPRYKETVEDICGVGNYSELIPNIPSVPMGYGDALVLLQSLGGKSAKDVGGDDFVGALDLEYTVGPSKDVVIHVSTDHLEEVRTIPNIVGVIPGTLEPEEDMPILLGNHRDAWVYGAADPNSGTVALIEVARSFGKLLKNGWKPLRTIYLLSWSGEEYGLLGSTGWAELNYDKLLKRAAVYLNVDTVNKGVMLTHGNLLHQISHRLAPTKQYDESEPLPGETMLSLLPVWHITERTFELWMAARGCNVVYSSIRTFKNDLAKHKPQWLVLVPRVLEKVAKGVQDKFASGSAAVKALSSLFTKTSMMKNKHLKITKGLVVADKPPGPLEKLVSRMIVLALAPLNAVGDKLVWSKVQDGFGGQLKTIISGGSALAGALEDFYETAGLTICVGYGLTECSPLISYRRSDANLVTAGCVGSPCLDTEFRVVDPELKAGNRERPALPDGDAGVVLGRGPQVMKGYFKNPEATAKAVDKFGWFDTGDLGRINPATGDLILTGRCKDTIVLSNGENIEPSPIEDAILSESSMIEQVMLVGQDGRSLTAIAVVSPKELESAGFLSKAEADELQKENEKVNDPKCGELDCVAGCEALNKAADKIRSNGELKNLLIADMKKATKPFRKWEQVSDVYVTLEPFAMANGQLTQSYKVKRDSVAKRYSDEL